jgi:bifunctional non-homologous end joining protein LigD
MLFNPWPTPRRRTPLAGFIFPCNPVLVAKPPAGPGWLQEVKHDGYRLLALKDGPRVKLWSRRGTDFTDKLTRTAESVRGLPAERALVDGEAVVFRADGLSDFEALLTKRGGEIASYVAFDLLTLEGEDLRLRPLEERRAALSQLVADANGILFSEAIAPKARWSFPRLASSALRGSCRSAGGAATRAGRAATG